MSSSGPNRPNETRTIELEIGVEHLPGEVQTLVERLQEIIFLTWLVNHPRAWAAWIVAILVPTVGFVEAQSRLNSGESAIAIIVDDYLFQQLLFPAGLWIYTEGLGILYAIGFFLFGPDLAVGRPVGLVDSPFAISGPIANTLTQGALIVINAVNEVNLDIAQNLEPLGLAAPTVATGFWAIELAALVWAGWIVFSSIDIPVIDQRGFLSSLTRPVRNLLEVFR